MSNKNITCFLWVCTDIRANYQKEKVCFNLAATPLHLHSERSSPSKEKKNTYLYGIMDSKNILTLFLNSDMHKLYQSFGPQGKPHADAIVFTETVAMSWKQLGPDE